MFDDCLLIEHESSLICCGLSTVTADIAIFDSFDFLFCVDSLYVNLVLCWLHLVVIIAAMFADLVFVH